MDPLLANIDLDSKPYAGTEHDTNKSLRDFALERITWVEAVGREPGGRDLAEIVERGETMLA